MLLLSSFLILLRTNYFSIKSGYNLLEITQKSSRTLKNKCKVTNKALTTTLTITAKVYTSHGFKNKIRTHPNTTASVNASMKLKMADSKAHNLKLLSFLYNVYKIAAAMNNVSCLLFKR